MRPFIPLVAVLMLGCAAATTQVAPDSHAFANPQPVALLGYDGDAMEPFLSRDGRYLLFNNRNDPSVNTNLHFAERVASRSGTAVSLAA